MSNISAFSSNEYDEKIKNTVPYYEDFYSQTIDIVKSIFSRKVSWLDTGCGTGKMAKSACEKIYVNRLVLCDSSKDMINIAKKNLQLPNAEYIVTATQDLNFKNEFDVVTSIMVHHYLTCEQRLTAVKKCYNALKPNGVFITFENTAPFTEVGRQTALKRWETYQINMGKSRAESQGHISRYNVNYFPITLSENLNLLKECGFKSAELIWFSYMQAGFMGIK